MKIQINFLKWMINGLINDAANLILDFDGTIQLDLV